MADLDRTFKRLFDDDEPTAAGSGWWSGAASVFCGFLAVAGVACFLFPEWLTTADRRRIPFSRLWMLLVYPFVWIVVILIRGATDGWVPYPFLDPAAGYVVLAMYVVAILVAMLTVGSLVILASRAPLLTARSR